MTVIVISPGYPAETPRFVRGLAAFGARVLGVGDQHEAALPEPARQALAGYLQVASLWDEDAVVAAVRAWVGEAAAERIGYPLVVKPVAGAGAADTHRVEGAADLARVARAVSHVPEVGVEEFIDGEEHTYDTLCADGRILHDSVSWYRPRLLVARGESWISPQTVTLRNAQRPEFVAGRALGETVIRTLGFATGFTHMEWFLTPAGEAVFVEIAARPPGARMVDLINYASDVDVYAGWAEAVCAGRFGQEVERRYNAAVIFKRALGPEGGRITRIDGLGPLMARHGAHVVCVDLLPVGAERRDWKRTFVADGYLILRHPDLQTTLEMADQVGVELQIHAG